MRAAVMDERKAQARHRGLEKARRVQRQKREKEQRAKQAARVRERAKAERAVERAWENYDRVAAAAPDNVRGDDQRLAAQGQVMGALAHLRYLEQRDGG